MHRRKTAHRLSEHGKASVNQDQNYRSDFGRNTYCEPPTGLRPAAVQQSVSVVHPRTGMFTDFASLNFRRLAAGTVMSFLPEGSSELVFRAYDFTWISTEARATVNSAGPFFFAARTRPDT